MRKHRLQVLSLIFISSAVSAILVSYAGIRMLEITNQKLIDDRLKENAGYWKILAETYDKEIDSQEKRVMRSAENIVTAQAKMTHELIEHAINMHKDDFGDKEKKELFDRLARNTVGRTGYIWILDYEGNYILSKNRERDGENIWESKDADGNFMVQDLISAGRKVKGGEIAYHSYPWVNIGEQNPREKIAAIIHLSEKHWVVGISTYYDDLVDMNYRTRTIEHVKNLIAQQTIGKSGYIWVVDSSGKYQVSKGRARDGEDISQSKDANGNYFILQAIEKAISGNNDISTQIYSWQNPGEQKPRIKIAGLSYMKEWDWIIGSSAYYDDLLYPRTYFIFFSVSLTAVFALLAFGVLMNMRFSRGSSEEKRDAGK